MISAAEHPMLNDGGYWAPKDVDDDCWAVKDVDDTGHRPNRSSEILNWVHSENQILVVIKVKLIKSFSFGNHWFYH